MNNDMKSKKSKNIYLIIYIVLYVLVCLISLTVIYFEFDLMDYHNRIYIKDVELADMVIDYNTKVIEYNTKVVKYYFVILPLAIAMPLLILFLISLFRTPRALYRILLRLSKKRECLSDNCVMPASIEGIQGEGCLNSMRSFSYGCYWLRISAAPQQAFRYMANHPDEFFVTTIYSKEPDWDGDNFCESMLVNGKVFYIYMHTRTFLTALKNCVEAIDYNARV